MKKSSFSQNPISWSEPLKRYNSRIWRILLLPSDDPRLIQGDAQLRNIKYEYNYGHRFNLYDLSFECGSETKNLFYNYTGVWQAQIDTTITGIALPTEFYEMVRNWRGSGNNTYNPILNFGLEQGGRKIRAPMSWFDIQLYDQEEHIRVAPGMGIISPDPVIRIGSKLLEHYFVVLDMFDYRVGFVSKSDIKEGKFNLENLLKI
jgi:hypothetical protein